MTTTIIEKTIDIPETIYVDPLLNDFAFRVTNKISISREELFDITMYWFTYHFNGIKVLEAQNFLRENVSIPYIMQEALRKLGENE